MFAAKSSSTAPASNFNEQRILKSFFSQRPTIGFPRHHFNDYWTLNQQLQIFAELVYLI